MISKKNATEGHGHAVRINGRKVRTPTYHSFSAMRKRCLDPRHAWFDRYGGRGILICERWTGPRGFHNFLADMGERPEGMSLDRIDNDRGYEPGNCRWATQAEQIQNSAKAKMTPDLIQEIRGRSEHGETYASIAARVGLHRHSVRNIVVRKAWSNVP